MIIQLNLNKKRKINTHNYFSNIAITNSILPKNDTAGKYNLNSGFLSCCQSLAFKGYFISPKRTDRNSCISFSGFKNLDEGSLLTSDQKEEIDKFLNNPVELEKSRIGKGDRGDVFKLRVLGQDIILKKSHSIGNLIDDEEFNKESKALKKIRNLPNSILNSSESQRLIASGTTDEGNKFIISTFVNGEKTNSKTNPLTMVQIKSMMDKLLELDKTGTWYNDFNPNNWLTTKNDAQIIDYGCSWDFSPLKGEEDRYPSNVAPSNLIAFQDKGLIPCLVDFYEQKEKSPEEIKDMFKDYLMLRSDFHKERSEFMKNSGLSGQEIDTRISYEELLSKILKEPSEDVVDLEAAKAQITYTQQMAYVDNWYGDNKDIYRDAHNQTYNKARYEFKAVPKYTKRYQDMIEHTLKHIDEKDFSDKNYSKEELKEYLNYEKDFVNTYYNKLWSVGQRCIQDRVNIGSSVDKEYKDKITDFFEVLKNVSVKIKQKL